MLGIFIDEILFFVILFSYLSIEINIYTYLYLVYYTHIIFYNILKWKIHVNWNNGVLKIFRSDSDTNIKISNDDASIWVSTYMKF